MLAQAPQDQVAAGHLLPRLPEEGLVHPPPQLVPADDLDAFPVEGHLHLPREPEGPVGGEADGHEGLGQDAFGKGDPGRPRGLLHEELPGVEEAGPVALPRLGAVEAPGLLGHHFFQPLGGDTADALQAEPPFHGLGQLVRLPEEKPASSRLRVRRPLEKGRCFLPSTTKISSKGRVCLARRRAFSGPSSRSTSSRKIRLRVRGVTPPLRLRRLSRSSTVWARAWATSVGTPRGRRASTKSPLERGQRPRRRRTKTSSTRGHDTTFPAGNGFFLTPFGASCYHTLRLGAVAKW